MPTPAQFRSALARLGCHQGHLATALGAHRSAVCRALRSPSPAWQQRLAAGLLVLERIKSARSETPAEALDTIVDRVGD